MKLHLWLLLISFLGKRGHNFNIVATASHFGVQKILTADSSNVYAQSLGADGMLSRNVIASPVERFPYQNLVVEYRYSVAGINRFRRFDSLFRLILALPLLVTPLFRWSANLKHLLASLIFNRRPTEANERYELLRYIVAHKAISDIPFSLHELMGEMYGYLCFTQEDHLWYMHKMKYQLASLVESRDVEMTPQGKYKVAGLAWKSLSDFQEENRKHKDSARLQFIMAMLTLAIAVFALAQSGIIRLPVLLDLHQEQKLSKPNVALPAWLSFSINESNQSSAEAMDNVLFNREPNHPVEHVTEITTKPTEQAPKPASKPLPKNPGAESKTP